MKIDGTCIVLHQSEFPVSLTIIDKHGRVHVREILPAKKNATGAYINAMDETKAKAIRDRLSQ